MSAKGSRSQFGARKLFREIRWEVLKVHFLLQLLNAAILFFALNIILTVFNMSFIYSAVVAVIFLAWRLTRGWQKDTLRRLEEGNPEVNEILRTAYEYRKEESLMVQGLLYDLQRKLPTVSAGVLINPRRLLSKLFAVAALAFVPILIISFTPFLLQENPLRDVDLSHLLDGGPAGVWDDVFGTELNYSDDIYGVANVAELGSDRLDIEVVSGGSGVTFERVSDPEDIAFRYNAYPNDVEAVEAEAASGVVYSAQDLALINTYSCTSKGACDQQ